MFDIFKSYLERKIFLDKQDYELIKSVSSFKKLRKHQYLLQEGDVSRTNIFVCRGLLRYYYADNKGHEHIIQFAPENYWTGDRDSMYSGLPSKYNIDAIEESEVLLLKKEDFDMLCNAIPAFNDFANETFKKHMVILQERIYVSISFSAEEKYSNFISKYSSLGNRVPMHMIASYLGMSAETLSRIRSQISRK